MCSMCPKDKDGYRPLAGDPDCTFIDWSEEETGWITACTNEPAGIVEERGSDVEFGESEEVSDFWIHWSDDAASWPEPGQWSLEGVGELPEWLVALENFSTVEPEAFFVDLAQTEILLAHEAELASIG